MAPEGPRAGSVRAKLVVNTILAISFVAISAPQATRMPVHEWLSLAFMGVLALHIVFSWAWVTAVTRRFVSAVRVEVRFNYALDALSYTAMIVCTISGLVISEAALPAIGIPRPSDRFWSVVHDLSSEALLILIGVHLAMHWDWVVAALKRLVAGSLGSGSTGGGSGRAWGRPLAAIATVSLVLSVATLALGKLPQAERMRAARLGARAVGGADAATSGRAKGTRSDKGGRAKRASATMAEAAEATSAAPPRSARPPRPAGGGGGLSWRQRYLRPGIKIISYMGIPFLMTIALLRTVGRKRAARPAAASDPLLQVAD